MGRWMANQCARLRGRDGSYESAETYDDGATREKEWTLLKTVCLKKKRSRRFNDSLLPFKASWQLPQCLIVNFGSLCLSSPGAHKLVHGSELGIKSKALMFAFYCRSQRRGEKEKTVCKPLFG